MFINKLLVITCDKFVKTRDFFVLFLLYLSIILNYYLNIVLNYLFT